MDDEDVQRRFAEIASGLTIDDLRGVMEQIGRARLADYLDRDRPELRHPPRPDTVSFRVRTDLVGAKPPIWRRLDGVAATGRLRHPTSMKSACEPCSKTSGMGHAIYPIAAR